MDNTVTNNRKKCRKLMGKPLLNVLVLIGGGGGKFSKKSGKEAGS